MGGGGGWLWRMGVGSGGGAQKEKNFTRGMCQRHLKMGRRGRVSQPRGGPCLDRGAGGLGGGAGEKARVGAAGADGRVVAWSRGGGYGWG